LPKYVTVIPNGSTKLNLRLFNEASSAHFTALLNDQTRKLQKALPRGARHWGTARKALNIFLRDALYNHYLCNEYGFNRLEQWLEVPLDRSMKGESQGKHFPRDWKEQKYLPCFPAHVMLGGSGVFGS
jgi:hypothetical protein